MLERCSICLAVANALRLSCRINLVKLRGWIIQENFTLSAFIFKDRDLPSFGVISGLFGLDLVNHPVMLKLQIL